MLHLLSAIVLAAALAVLRSDRRIVRRLRRAGALAAPSAVPLAVATWRLARLVRLGVVREAAPGTYYLDGPGHDAYRRARRRRLLRVLLAALLLGLSALWLRRAGAAAPAGESAQLLRTPGKVAVPLAEIALVLLVARVHHGALLGLHATARRQNGRVRGEPPVVACLGR